jgi:hypothetical protein
MAISIWCVATKRHAWRLEPTQVGIRQVALEDEQKLRPAFPWHHYVFGDNIIAGCVRWFAGIGLFIVAGTAFFSWLATHLIKISN